jgi:hypothetical protein
MEAAIVRFRRAAKACEKRKEFIRSRRQGYRQLFKGNGAGIYHHSKQGNQGD